MDSTTAMSNENKWLLERFETQDHLTKTWRQEVPEKTDKQNCYLRLIHPQLLIDVNGIVSYSVDLSNGTGAIEVQYANSNIAITSTDQNGKASKIRMRFANDGECKSGVYYCMEVIDKLRKFVPVFKHPSHVETPIERKDEVTVRKLTDVLKGLISNTCFEIDPDVTDIIIPENVMEEVIDAFILHPQFPEKVVEICEMYSKLKGKEN